MVKETYHIATATENEAYFVPMYVMLYSLFSNNTAHTFCVHVLYGELDSDKKAQLEQLAARYGNSINWIQVIDKKIISYYTLLYVTAATYYRILAPSLLPAEVQKVLFLDADIIVHADIEELYTTDMGNCPIMAVREVIPYKIERLGILPSHDYFNAGVLLLNLDEWRRNDYTTQVLSNVETQHSNYLMFDQDALNAFFYDKVNYLHPRWNHQTGFYHLTPKQLQDRYGEKADVLLNQASIIHFIGYIKPWHYISTHPFKPLFLQYLSQTPYKAFAERGTIPRFTQKTIRRIKHKLEKIFS